MIRWLVVLMVLLASVAEAGPVTRSRAEWVNGLPVNGGAYIVYSVAGWVSNTVLITGQVEVTSELPYTVGLGSYLIRSDGQYAALPTMENVTNSDHHRVLRFASPDSVPHPGWWAYYVVLYAVSSAGDGWIRVEPGYGEVAMTSLVTP